MTDTYESWRITFQSSEAAARSAYADVERLARENAELRKKLEAAMARTTKVESTLSLYVNIGEMKSRDGLVTTRNGGDMAYSTLYGCTTEQEPPL